MPSDPSGETGPRPPGCPGVRRKIQSCWKSIAGFELLKAEEFFFKKQLFFKFSLRFFFDAGQEVSFPNAVPSQQKRNGMMDNSEFRILIKLSKNQSGKKEKSKAA
jgi:hypothetical protein